MIKRRFGFLKLRYHGLDKNAHRLFVTCTLANLFTCVTEGCVRVV
ncbi:hypothetical protein [Acidiphilium iwatense]|nr:hypothetical protein [Acidiphilium iwatense]